MTLNDSMWKAQLTSFIDWVQVKVITVRPYWGLAQSWEWADLSQLWVAAAPVKSSSAWAQGNGPSSVACAVCAQTPWRAGAAKQDDRAAGEDSQETSTLYNPFAFESIGYLFKVKAKNFKDKTLKGHTWIGHSSYLGEYGNRRLRGIKVAVAAILFRNEGSFRAGRGTRGLPTFPGHAVSIFYIFFY